MNLENLKLIKGRLFTGTFGVGIVIIACVIIVAIDYVLSDKQDKELMLNIEKQINDLKPLTAVNDNLIGITTKLNNIETQVLKPSTNVEPLQQQITNLTEETKALNKENKESKELISTSIDNVARDLKESLSGIEDELLDLNEKQKQAVFIKEDNLPFGVLHIDNIQGNTIATIRYNNTIFPISEGENLAGWRLIRAAFHEQEAEFVNDKNEHVRVSLKMPNTNKEVL